MISTTGPPSTSPPSVGTAPPPGSTQPEPINTVHDELGIKIPINGFHLLNITVNGEGFTINTKITDYPVWAKINQVHNQTAYTDQTAHTDKLPIVPTTSRTSRSFLLSRMTEKNSFGEYVFLGSTVSVIPASMVIQAYPLGNTENLIQYYGVDAYITRKREDTVDTLSTVYISNVTDLVDLLTHINKKPPGLYNKPASTVSPYYEFMTGPVSPPIGSMPYPGGGRKRKRTTRKYKNRKLSYKRNNKKRTTKNRRRYSRRK